MSHRAMRQHRDQVATTALGSLMRRAPASAKDSRS